MLGKLPVSKDDRLGFSLAWESATRLFTVFTEQGYIPNIQGQRAEVRKLTYQDENGTFVGKMFYGGGQKRQAVIKLREGESD